MGKEARAHEQTRRTLAFDADDAVRFKLLYQAFLTRGSRKDERPLTLEERKSEGRILAQLKAISDGIGQEPKPGEPDGRMRELSDAGGSVTLDGPDYARLLRYVRDHQVPVAFMDAYLDLEQFVADAQEADAKPELHDVKRGA